MSLQPKNIRSLTMAGMVISALAAISVVLSPQVRAGDYPQACTDSQAQACSHECGSLGFEYYSCSQTGPGEWECDCSN